MQALVEHLDLLAKRDIASLRKLCGVDDEDITDMIGEIRRLDPKPGLKFGSARTQTMVPRACLSAARTGRRLACRAQQRHRCRACWSTRPITPSCAKTIRKDGDKTYFTDCLQNATWLVRALDQRGRRPS